MSPLMLAAQQEDIACVRLLLTHNADVHARDSDGDNGNLRESERAFRARARVCVRVRCWQFACCRAVRLEARNLF